MIQVRIEFMSSGLVVEVFRVLDTGRFRLAKLVQAECQHNFTARLFAFFLLHNLS